MSEKCGSCDNEECSRYAVCVVGKDQIRTETAKDIIGMLARAKDSNSFVSGRVLQLIKKEYNIK